MSKIKLVVGIGGSSGAVYAKLLLDKLLLLKDQTESIGVVMSENAKTNWQLEVGALDWSRYPFTFYDNKDFFAPFASGSARFNTMIVCPCSMGLLARIAQGISNDLLTRAADVMLKEHRKLILVPRETPLSLIHLRNMTSVAEAGAILCPAIPSFYSKPETIEAVLATVVDRVLSLAGFEFDSYKWGEKS